MSERINHKIKQIVQFLAELETIKPNNFEEYTTNLIKKGACERYCEKIIECAVDISFLVFKDIVLTQDKNVVIPKDDSEVFEILATKEILSFAMSRKLIEAKAMRNHLAHKYGEIDDTKVFHAVSEELNKDMNDFLNLVELALKKRSDGERT